VDTIRPQRKKATNEYLEKDIWRKKCGQQDTSTAGGRWRRQNKTELDGDKWSVDYVPPGATWHMSSS